MDVAKSRVESLNPLVMVETLSHSSALEGQALDDLVQAVDLVCVTDWDRDGLVSTYGFTMKVSLGLSFHNRFKLTTRAEGSRNHSMQVGRMDFLAIYSATS